MKLPPLNPLECTLLSLKYIHIIAQMSPLSVELFHHPKLKNKKATMPQSE